MDDNIKTFVDMKISALHRRLHVLCFERIYAHFFMYHTRKLRQKFILKSLRKKKTVNVVFFAVNVSMWKYQHLYDLMSGCDRFKVSIVLAPFVNYPEAQQEFDMKCLREYFDAKGIGYYDFKSKFINIRKELHPDILFYPQPYKKVFDSHYNSTSFYGKLLAYYPYGFWTSVGDWSYNNEFQNLAWKLYYSTELHRKDAETCARNKGENVVIVGYPGADDFLQSSFKDVWKIKDPKIKRLIWAPHFTIDPARSEVARANFLWMAPIMLSIAQEYKDRLQIAFKPHPSLKSELYKHKDWGQAKADAYYDKWATMPNTQLESGEYVDLFMTSDAMVHDSGSFSVDYLFSHKPLMFVSQNLDYILSTQGEFGRKVYEMPYIGKDEADIRHFIDDVVLGGNDPMQEKRQAFFNQYLLPPNGKSTAQNTLDDLLASL
jgi:CDP-glycerol glycerophosphotransferase (TagB/SpsB family)